MAVVVIDTIKPKNNGTFPVVEAVDVKVTAELRLDAALSAKADASTVATLSEAVAGKASQADLTALQTVVNGKASQSDLTALSNTVADKADKSALAETNAALAGKQAALTEVQLEACNSGITSTLVAQIDTNTTAIEGKADASDLTTATANLQAQIDELVAPVTQDAEVQNARVGADGTSYVSLKARLDAENTEISSSIDSINHTIYNYDTTEIDNIADVSTVTAPNTYKWIAAIVPANAVVSDIKQKVVADSTEIVKLEVWELNNGNYTLARTITATSSEADYGSTYVLTFAGFTTSKKTIITYSDTSSQGWLQYDNMTGYSCKRFDASLSTVTDSDISTVNTVRLHADLEYTVSSEKYTSEISDIEANIDDIEDDIVDLENNVNEINAAIFTNETVEVDNITDTGTSIAPNSYKWIAAIIPPNATVSDIKQRVTANSTEIVKLQIWELNNGSYTPTKTITAKSIEAGYDSTYILTFEGFKTTKKTIITYLDTSSGGWLRYSQADNYSCKRFDASLLTITDSDISTVDTVRLHVDLEYTYKKLNEKTPYIYVVDAEGGGDYTSIAQAVSELPSNSVIMVKPGVYEGTVRAFQKRINLIGTDRKKCIIRSTDGRYEYPAIECCCGSLSNLTIESKYVSGTSHEIASTDSGAYAVHCEQVGNNESIAIGNCLTISDCDIISDFFPALGVGTFKDWSINIINCFLVSNQVSGRGTYTEDGGLGALYFHDMNGTKGTANINLKDTVIRTGSLATTITAYDLNQTDAEIKCEFINNTIYSAVNGFTDSVWWRGVTTPFGNHISLEDISHGNTGTVFNA